MREPQQNKISSPFISGLLGDWHPLGNLERTQQRVKSEADFETF